MAPSVGVDQLAAPLTLPCGLTLKNRLCKAAMTENCADALGQSTPRLAALYRRWADCGCGMLLTGNVQIDRRYLERPGNVCIDAVSHSPSEIGIARLKALARAGVGRGMSELTLATKSGTGVLGGLANQNHSPLLEVSGLESGSIIWVQLSHAGRQSSGKVCLEPVAPSAVPLEGIPRLAVGAPRAMTREEVAALPARFAAAALVCRDCGFGGVQLHAAHGYLLSSFLNPKANIRDDEYGGALSARAKVLLDTVDAVRKAVGKAFPISVKLNSADFQQGGFSEADAAQVAQWLYERGVDLLEVSGGSYESNTICTDSSTIGQHKDFGRLRESTRKREAYYALFCANLRKSVPGLPVMLTGGFRSRQAMEAALLAGEVDVIGLGRPLCGDPDAANKLLSGEIERLPSYEDELQFGWWPIQWIFELHWMLRLLRTISVQAWYYCNIYRMADGKATETTSSLTPLYAMQENERVEGELAGNLFPSLGCFGTHYNAGLMGAHMRKQPCCLKGWHVATFLAAVAAVLFRCYGQGLTQYYKNL